MTEAPTTSVATASVCLLELRHSIVVNFMELPCNIFYRNAIFLNKIPDIGTVSLSLYEHYVMEIAVLELLCVIRASTVIYSLCPVIQCILVCPKLT